MECRPEARTTTSRPSTSPSTSSGYAQGERDEVKVVEHFPFMRSVAAYAAKSKHEAKSLA
jgi:hypothetical protein